jgi:hypothetical protein
MGVFRTKWFSRFARQNAILDKDLCEAIRRAEQGLINADLGSGVIKQRVSRKNEGKSGGFRTIILFRSGHNSFFVYGFPKSEQENVRSDEVKAFKALAKEMLDYSVEQIKAAVDAEALFEVICNEQ